MSLVRLARLDLDRIAVIHGPLTVSGAPRVLREQSFVDADGWDIRETLPGVFTLSRDDMPEPVTLGGYAYAYVKAALPPEPEESPTKDESPQAKKRKR